MLKTQNKKSLVYGIPGILLQAVGIFSLPIGLIGTVLLVIGLGYYAKAKGHSGLFGLLGLLSWLGVIVLMCLKDRHETEHEKIGGVPPRSNDDLPPTSRP